MEEQGSGHAGLWPELFDAGAALVKSQFPQFGDAVEVGDVLGAVGNPYA